MIFAGKAIFGFILIFGGARGGHHAPVPVPTIITTPATGTYCDATGYCTTYGGVRHDGIVCDPWCREDPQHAQVCTPRGCYPE